MESIIEVKISDLGEVVTGNTPPTQDRKLYDGNYPLIMPTDIVKGQKYIGNTEETISDLGFKKYKKSLIPANTPCVVTIGTIGKKICLSKEDSFTNQAINAVKVYDDKYDPVFIFYLLKYNLPQVKNLSSGTASGRENVSKSSFGKIKVKLPETLKAQQKIASILSAYDDLIENNNQRIKLLEEMAEEIYKEWFVRLRFPGYENVKVVDGMPEGWEMKRIKEFGKVITGKTPSKNDECNFDGEIPFIKTPDMQQGMYFIETEESLSKKGAESQSSQYIPKNAISVSCIGTVGKVGITTKLSQTNQQINSLIPKSSFLLEYLYFTILSLKPVIESYAATGATMANLSKSKFENLKTIEPSSELLRKFSEILQPMFKEMKVLMEKNIILQQTRDLLLPRLISGKLSVEDINIEEEVNQDNFYVSAEHSLSEAAEPETKYNKLNQHISTL